MQVYYLKESENKIKGLFFGKIIIKNNKEVILPINNKTSLSRRKTKNIIKQLHKMNIKTVILSSYLNSIERLKEELISQKIKYLDGRLGFKILLNEVLEYICKTDMAKLKISILTKNAINDQIILDIAKKVKNINIVTNNPKSFYNMEEYLFNELGIITKLSHNIDKTSNIIINFDFEQEEINKQKIPNHCIIISVNQNITINSKSFQGIIIKDFNIVIPSKLKINGFDDKNIYESIIINKNNKVYKNYNYNEIRKMIKTDRIRIENLLGEKGIINDKEFYNFFLTKS